MATSWIFVVILVLVAALPFILLAVVRLSARVVPEQFERLAAVEREQPRAYWGVVAALYAILGIAHLASSTGEPFGWFFVGLAIPVAIKAARAPRLPAA